MRVDTKGKSCVHTIVIKVRGSSLVTVNSSAVVSCSNETVVDNS